LMMEAIYSSQTSVLQDLHGVTSQKTAFFIVAAVKISNLTLSLLICLFQIRFVDSHIMIPHITHI
jgi:hypothetical protein